MSTKTLTQTHAADREIFIPSGVDISDVKLPGDLHAPYIAVREAISRTHNSVREMWGAVFEFAVTCRKEENEDAFKQVRDHHNVTTKKSSSQFNPAVKIAIGTPRWDEEVNKIVFDIDDNQVTRFCKVFDFAYEEFRRVTKEEFVAWLNDSGSKGGGGSISECLARATDWLNSRKPLGGKIDDEVLFDLRLGKLRERNREAFNGLFASRGDFASYGLEEGKHYTLTVTVEGGQPAVDILQDVDDGSFRKAVAGDLPALEQGETPLTLAQFFTAVCKEAKSADAIDVTFANGTANVSGENKDGPFSVSYLLRPDISDTSFSLSKLILAEIRRCLSVFKEGPCQWSLEDASIAIKLPEKQTAQKMERTHNANRRNKIALDDRIVKYQEDGGSVLILFEATDDAGAPQMEFEPV